MSINLNQMDQEILRIKTLLKKFKAGKCSDDEILELFDASSSDFFSKAVKMSMPDDFALVESVSFPKSEINRSYEELCNRLGLECKRSFHSRFRKYMKYAAMFLFPLILSILSWFLFFNNDNISEISFAVEKGNKGYFELADGSKVWLNGNSKMFYAASDERTVRLDGGAYFEIAHRKDDQFKVKTSYFDIIVYGTSFNVSSYETDEIVEVALIEGSIGIRDNEKDLFKITPGQVVQYNKLTNHYSVSDKDMTDVSLWTNKELVIRDMSDTELFKKLSSWYQLDIKVINKDPNKIKYNLVITNESLENMLELISKLSSIDYKTQGKEVIIRYK